MLVTSMFPFPQIFSSFQKLQCKSYFIFRSTLILSAANAFTVDKSKKFSFDNTQNTQVLQMAKPGDTFPYAPRPFMAEDAAFLLPPPSYEEVMGVYQTSVKPVQVQHQDMPPLSYIDIMPRCLKIGNIKEKVKPTFDNFSAIMEGANQWLREHPGLVVWKCETVIRKLGTSPDGSLTYDLNDMLRPDPTYGYVAYIRGLRLWLTKNLNPGSTPQQLGLRNEIPPREEILVPAHRFGYFFKGLSFTGDVTMQGGIGFRKFTTFKNLYKSIEKINEKLTTDPLPGTILTVETDYIKAYELFKEELDPETACWDEDKLKFRRETQIIRIFYILGSPAREMLGMKDFTPDMTFAADFHRQAGFEKFDTLLHNMSNWISAKQGIRIVNIQQNDVLVDKFFGRDVGISPEDTDRIVSKFSKRRVVQTCRLFYVISATGAPPAPMCISSRLFTPERTGPGSFETMTKTMDRIDAWLKVTGLPIFSVYTLENLYTAHKQAGMDTEKTDYVIPSTSSSKWLTAIRVFFPMVYQEPDPLLLPPKSAYKQGSGSCNII